MFSPRFGPPMRVTNMNANGVENNRDGRVGNIMTTKRSGRKGSQRKRQWSEKGGKRLG